MDDKKNNSDVEIFTLDGDVIVAFKQDLSCKEEQYSFFKELAGLDASLFNESIGSQLLRKKAYEEQRLISIDLEKIRINRSCCDSYGRRRKLKSVSFTSYVSPKNGEEKKDYFQPIVDIDWIRDALTQKIEL